MFMFQEFKRGSLRLNNRIVLAPMTRVLKIAIEMAGP